MKNNKKKTRHKSVGTYGTSYSCMNYNWTHYCGHESHNETASGKNNLTCYMHIIDYYHNGENMTMVYFRGRNEK